MQCEIHDANQPCRLCLHDRIKELEAQLKKVREQLKGADYCEDLAVKRYQRAEAQLDAVRDENSAIRYIITGAIKHLKDGVASKHTDNEKMMMLVAKHLKVALNGEGK